MNKKKQYMAAVIFILAGLLLFGKVLWDYTAAPTDEAAASQSEAAKQSDADRDPALSPEKDPNLKVLKDMLYGNTYEYVDEYRSGHPVTYTFYADGRLFVYYWESEEDEDVPIGSTSAVYTVNDAMDEITITWDDDGSTEVKAFDLGRRKITLGKSELKKIKKDIYEN